MRVELKPIEVATVDHEGQLILHDGALVGVLVRLSNLHGDLSGNWYLETGYGRLRDERLTFPDLDAAISWIDDRLTKSPETSGQNKLVGSPK
jgi:hypothetical protein